MAKNKIKIILLWAFFLIFLLGGALIDQKQSVTVSNQAGISSAKLSVTATTTPSSSFIPTGDFGLVARVVDGDTIVVNLNGREEKIRLIGINTPEIVDSRKPVECFGREASDRAKAILTNQTVRLEFDLSQDRYDKYGRLLVYVWLSDGTNFNLKMIQDGFAYEYTYHLPYKYQTEFKAALRAARQASRGLWSGETCAGKR
ncbi:MAG: thermonuclease family protein [Patescibacteria group bacterium]